MRSTIFQPYRPQIMVVILMITAHSSFAQLDWDDKDWSQEALGFGCSYGGEKTAPVKDITKLISGKRMDAIRAWLDSRTPTRQFLAAYVLDQLQRKNKLELSNQEQKKIQVIKQSDVKVHVCSGCTYFDVQPIRSLFDPVNRHYMFELTENWFSQLYKEVYGAP